VVLGLLPSATPLSRIQTTAVVNRKTHQHAQTHQLLRRHKDTVNQTLEEESWTGSQLLGKQVRATAGETEQLGSGPLGGGWVQDI
jgi:hypothetical protein